MDRESKPNDEANRVDADSGKHTVAIDDFLASDSPDATQSPLPPASNDARVLAAEREVLRSRAELENFRKRMQRDAEQQLKYANMPLVRELLDVLDNLNRALNAAQGDEASATALREGVGLVAQQLIGVLSKYGCTPIAAEGAPFDPNYHEAIAQMPSEQHAAGLVAQEVAVGYILHDRVARPCQVIVSTGAPAQESQER